jgi:hypothetical protein
VQSEDVEGSDHGVTEVQMPEETKGKSKGFSAWWRETRRIVWEVFLVVGVTIVFTVEFWHLQC